MAWYKKGRILRWVLIALMTGLVAACGGAAAPATPTAAPEAEADFSPVVSATGVVTPAQWATLSIKTAGTVDDLLVMEGEQVKTGQTILRLSGNDALEAAVAAAKLELTSAQQGLDTLIENADQARAQAQLALVKAQDEYDDAKEKRESKQYLRTDQETLDIARANLIIAEDGVTQAEINYDRFDSLPEDNPMRAEAFSQLAAARQRRDKALANLNWLLGKPDAQEIAEADAKVEVAKANLNAAEREWERVKDGPDPRALALAQARLENAQKQLDAATQALADLTLAAPFDGTVTKVYVRAKEWVSPGQPVALLADLGRLRVETTDLSEIDVVQVEVGDTVTVTFDALPEVTVQGVVDFISPKAAEGSGVNYTVIVELKEIPEKLRWGMTAFVDIQISR
jgi:HlyD family secretion protein